MLTIRFMRFGRKRQPFFRLVVVPKRGKSKRGKYVENVGWVDPLQHTHAVNAERVKHWLSVGAQPSVSAWNLFVREGILKGAKRPKVAAGKLRSPQGVAAAEQPTIEEASQVLEERTEAQRIPENSSEGSEVEAGVKEPQEGEMNEVDKSKEE